LFKNLKISSLNSLFVKVKSFSVLAFSENSVTFEFKVFAIKFFKSKPLEFACFQASISMLVGASSLKSTSQTDKLNTFVKSVVWLFIGFTASFANSVIKSVEYSIFTYEVTFIALTNGSSNCGKLLFKKSIHKYPFLSVKNAI
jgi:hypothetical protein